MTTATTTERIYNFSAGPAVMPLPVLEKAQRELTNLNGIGMSIMEISHRSKPFEEIIARAEKGIRDLLKLPENYHVLFLQGGASLQFSMVPINFLAKDRSADYILTGTWSKKAAKEAKRVGPINIAATAEEGNFKRIPRQEELKLDEQAVYVHITTNNTIHGTQWRKEPETGSVPIVADSSSDILSRAIDVQKYGLIFGGAQKNLGPSGVTVVIIRDDMLKLVPDGLHTMLDYRVQVENKSLYNTPNTFGIYIIDLVCQWIGEKGGLGQMERENEAKAKLLYDAIDATDFYQGHAEREARSLMNVTFRLPSEDLEKQFAKEATAAQLDGLKGHRSVGGLRASIYNAFPREGVEALVSFMKEFERKNG